MNKHTSMSDSEMDVAAYISALWDNLRSQLPAAASDELAAEIEARLRDCVDELQRDGISAYAAVANATSRLGTPEEYARRLAGAAVETTVSRRAAICRRIAAVLLFTALLVPLSVLPGELWGGPEAVVRWIAGIALLSIAGLLSAFESRKADTRFLLRCGAVMTLATVAIAGFSKTVVPTGQWEDRRLAAQRLEWDRRQIATSSAASSFCTPASRRFTVPGLMARSPYRRR